MTASPILVGVLCALLGACAKPTVLVLASQATPHLNPTCPKDLCQLETMESPARVGHVSTVILSGHSDGITVLGTTPELAAQRVAAHSPELVVLDVCYGASERLLLALSQQHVTARVVGPAFKIKAKSLIYGEGFFREQDLATRAAMVKAPFDRMLTQGTVAAGPLVAARAAVDAMDQAALRKRLVRIAPNLVRQEVDGLAGDVLFLVEPARFQ